MRKLLTIALLLCFAIVASAQMKTVAPSKWDGFFKPVTVDKITNTENDRAGTGS